MTDVTANVQTARPTLSERLQRNADGILEQIAKDYGVSTFDAVSALPGSFRTIAAD